MKLMRFAEAAIRLLYPADCELCRTPLELEERQLCPSCKDRLSASKQAPLTLLDLKIPHVKQAWTFYSYESPVRELLTGIKFERKTWLTGAFDGDLDGLKAHLPSDLDAVVPVPLDRMKFIHREFNQSGIFAKKIANVLGIRTIDALIKKRPTAAQHGLSREERAVNLTGAFKTVHPEKIAGRNILLVDDVLTTGATARETARTLKAAGAKNVYMLAIAHTEMSGGLS